MSWLKFHLRSLGFHWKSHLWVTLAVAVAAAVLTGALVVGDSMRGSLRDLAVGRLGRVDYAMAPPRVFGADLADRVANAFTAAATGDVQIASLFMVRGAATHATSRSRAGRINILGVDANFWALDSFPPSPSAAKLDRDEAVLNQPLADELGAKVGDDCLFHLGKLSSISAETLLGRRDETTSTLRLKVAAILDPKGLAAFDLNPSQAHSPNAFVTLSTLQRALDQPDKSNVLLMAAKPQAVARVDQLQRALSASLTIRDVGLQLRAAREDNGMIIESDALLIEPALEKAIVDAAQAIGGAADSRFLAYLANAIAKSSDSEGASKIIPYSTIVAIDPASLWMQQLRLQIDNSELALEEGEILLNEWAAEDLEAQPGDSVTITYYITGEAGEVVTRSASFVLRGIVPIAGILADPDLVPPYKGVTDARSLADWDPPFPIDLKLIRDKDEEYWKEHRTIPKAFISLADGQRLWAENGDRFGRVTAIRLVDIGARARNLRLEFEQELKRRLDGNEMGFMLRPVREQMITASSGPTDFGMLFLSFSFFLIASAAMLVSLLFRLGVEKRAFEIGLLLATGFSARAVTGMLVVQGLLVSLVGASLGLIAAAGFAWLMLAGLRTWWSAAVHAPQLGLHLKISTLVLGTVLSVGIAIATIAGSVRGLSRRAPRGLLSGLSGDDSVERSAPWRGQSAAVAFFLIACVIAGIVFGAKADAMGRSLGFFTSGLSALGLCMFCFVVWLRAHRNRSITTPGMASILRMGIRSARRNRRRSVLTAGLLASAAFLIVSLETFRLDPSDADGKHSGSGGYGMYAESAVPLPYDLNTTEGREHLGFAEPQSAALGGMSVASFRLRPGDDSSCLNLYRPTRPRILGATQAFLDRNGFAFAESLSPTPEAGANPWVLLNSPVDEGVIPAIADANAVRWQYHLGLGKDLVIQDEAGRDASIRFVALLSNSALQDEIIISDEHFTRLFPSISGRSFFLIEAPQGIEEVERTLEAQLEPFGFDAATTQSRLRDYFAVQNTYISTFQTLGGLGLVLGAAGLAVVLVRNVWERRRELALMRTAGFTRASLALLVLAENLALVVAGLTAGVLSSLLSVAPVIVKDDAALPVVRLGGLIACVLVVGALAGLWAVSSALRAPLIPALRRE